MANIRTDFVNEILDRLEINSAITKQEKELVFCLLTALHASVEPVDLELKKEWNELNIGG